MSGGVGSPDVFVTATLAGLYFDQGSYREAAEIYEKLLTKNPSDLESKVRLEEALLSMKKGGLKLQSSAKSGHQDSSRAWQSSYLQAWLDNIQMDRGV